MTPAHKIDFPVFDPTWPWAGASLLLKTDEHLVLIKRSLTMPTHAGQMAFFGGHKKDHEKHPIEVACREYEEESGLSSQTIECVGVLNPVKTAKQQPIIPVVADLKIPIEVFLKNAVSNGEWSELLAVPWKELSHPDYWSWGLLKGATEHKILTSTIAKDRYLHHRGSPDKDHVLWGATARMVWNYLALYYQSPKN
jgi:8-oxo-dGTP pyrophosphatase MutT (NUDIX family)